MSQTPNNTAATNSSSNRNYKSIQRDELNPKPSCSKDLTNCDVKNNLDVGIEPYNLKYDEDTEENTLIPLQMLPLRCGGILNSYSAHEIYDDNNNCMLTNLNEIGLRYFNINDNDESVEKNLSNNNNLDFTPNEREQIVECLIADLDNIDSNETRLEEINEINSEINKNMNILNLDDFKENSFIHKDIFINNVDSHQHVLEQNVNNETVQLEEYIDIHKYYEFPKWYSLIHDDIEQSLKCNIIAKVSVADNDKEIDNNSNDNIFKKTEFESQNGNIEHNIKDDNSNFVDTERKGCSLVNNRKIYYATNYRENQSDESDACSYHSSDFEFIDEEEASKECKLNISTIDMVNNITENNAKNFDDNYIINDYFSGSKPVLKTSIPSGDDYHNLFLRQNVPHVCLNMEQKAISSTRGMEVLSAPAFDLKCLLKDDAECKKEADTSIKIILSMYPKENSRVQSQKRK